MPTLGHAHQCIPSGARFTKRGLDFKTPKCHRHAVMFRNPIVGSVMRRYIFSTLLGLSFCCPVLLAQTTAPASTSDRIAKLEAQVAQAQSSADNAWMLTSSALVLMMTGPGLALFYGGLVRKKNV